MKERIMVIDCQRDLDIEKAIDELDTIQYIVFDIANDFYICDTLTEAEKLADKIQGTIYFYHTTMVNNIIGNLDEKAFETINNADYDRFDLDSRIRRNGQKRLAYNLNKIGLTLTDWDIWCTL